MQSPDPSQNYFELFGLEPAFDIDTLELRDRQQRLQTAYHPDRYASADDRERRLSVQMSSWVNQAYDTLRDPVKRSRYLLEISGAEIPDDSQTTSDSAFLMEQLELRESIEACRQADNATERCREIAEHLDRRMDELSRGFAINFTAGKAEQALDHSRKMQFIQRIQQQLAEIRFDLEDF